MTNDSSGLVRTCVYGALGHLEVKEVINELHEGIFDSNIEAVKSAAYALSRIGEHISQKEIEKLNEFDDPDFEKILKFFAEIQDLFLLDAGKLKFSKNLFI